MKIVKMIFIEYNYLSPCIFNIWYYEMPGKQEDYQLSKHNYRKEKHLCDWVSSSSSHSLLQVSLSLERNANTPQFYRHRCLADIFSKINNDSQKYHSKENWYCLLPTIKWKITILKIMHLPWKLVLFSRRLPNESGTNIINLHFLILYNELHQHLEDLQKSENQYFPTYQWKMLCNHTWV